MLNASDHCPECGAVFDPRGRSMKSHRHEFAWLKQAWLNLPERCRMEPWAQSPEHLRKYALIRTGYNKTSTYTGKSRGEAFRFAAFQRSEDEYCIVTIEDRIAFTFRADSQSLAGMGSKRFQESKTAIIDFLDDLIGAPRGTLAKMGETV